MKTGKRRLAAFAVVAATMVLALVGVAAPAWAEGQPTNPQLSVTEGRVTITSKLTMDKYAVEPNAALNIRLRRRRRASLRTRVCPLLLEWKGPFRFRRLP